MQQKISKVNMYKIYGFDKCLLKKYFVEETKLIDIL